MNPKWVVNDVKALDDYKLLIICESQEKKIFDCSPLLQYEINRPLQNDAFFKTVFVKDGTVAWNDEIDIDPEYLYAESVLVI